MIAAGPEEVPQVQLASSLEVVLVAVLLLCHS